MTFEWDEAKNRANITKHGVSFETARRIFDGPVLTRFDESDHEGEVREISIGSAGADLIVVVVHTDRDGVTRLISARRATRTERNRYHDELARRSS
jgi:hypothetical protein